MKGTDSGAQPSCPGCRGSHCTAGLAGIQCQHRANSSPATAQEQLQVPPCPELSAPHLVLLGAASMGSQHWFCRGESSPFQQRPRFTQQIELNTSLSIPPETVGTGSLCPVHSIKRHSFLHEEGLWNTEHSSRQQINAGPELMARGWNLGKLGLK